MPAAAHGSATARLSPTRTRTARTRSPTASAPPSTTMPAAPPRRRRTRRRWWARASTPPSASSSPQCSTRSSQRPTSTESACSGSARGRSRITFCESRSSTLHTSGARPSTVRSATPLSMPPRCAAYWSHAADRAALGGVQARRGAPDVGHGEQPLHVADIGADLARGLRHAALEAAVEAVDGELAQALPHLAGDDAPPGVVERAQRTPEERRAELVAHGPARMVSAMGPGSPAFRRGGARPGWMPRGGRCMFEP